MKGLKDNPVRKKLYIHPNESAKRIARRALNRRKALPKSKRGGLDALQAGEQGIGSGVMRARDIASGKRVNAYQVKAFFDRHRHNFVKAKSDGKSWGNSKALQAWDLWGGEPLRRQVEKAVREDKRARKNPMAKEKPYTIYLVQDKPKGFVLYSFKSGELVSPSASASEYAWLLGESVLEESGTHIFTSEAKLNRFLRKSDKKIFRGNIRYSNPRNSKVKDALAAEATRYKDFNEFADAYWNACSRGLYWYATNESRFHIGMEERKRIQAGTFTVSCNPNLALSGRNEGKKYVAELDVTRLPNGSVKVKRGTNGAQIKITGSPGSVKVLRVLDADQAAKAFKWQLSILPSSKEELRKIWEKAWNKRKRDAKKREIRKQKELERELKRAEVRAREDAKAAERERKRRKKRADKKKKVRVAEGKAAQARRKSVKRISESKAVARQNPTRMVSVNVNKVRGK